MVGCRGNTCVLKSNLEILSKLLKYIYIYVIVEIIFVLFCIEEKIVYVKKKYMQLQELH